MTVTGEILPDEPGYLLEFDEVYDTDPDDLWEAITTPDRLARWMAVYRGEFRLGGHWQAMRLDGGAVLRRRGHLVRAAGGVHDHVDDRRRAADDRDRPARARGSRTRLRLRHEHVARLEFGPGWHAYSRG